MAESCFGDCVSESALALRTCWWWVFYLVELGGGASDKKLLQRFANEMSDAGIASVSGAASESIFWIPSGTFWNSVSEAGLVH